MNEQERTVLGGSRCRTRRQRKRTRSRWNPRALLVLPSNSNSCSPAAAALERLLLGEKSLFDDQIALCGWLYVREGGDAVCVTHRGVVCVVCVERERERGRDNLCS